MTYTVKEIFKTLQGEGANAGRTAVFLRFAGCNLWTGREEDRANAICKFCDTQFVGGTKYETADALADAVEREWGHATDHRMVVVTGGEPALQWDKALWTRLNKRHFYIAIETNGTIALDGHVDWKCVSPKARTNIVTWSADELKFVYPQEGFDPEDAAAATCAEHHFIQPMDGPRLKENTAAAIAYVRDHPRWRLSIQTHKILGIP